MTEQAYHARGATAQRILDGTRFNWATGCSMEEAQKLADYLREPGADTGTTLPLRMLDGKFGITNGGKLVKASSGEEIPEWEPLHIMRARDRLSLPLLRRYREISVNDGCNEYHLAGVDAQIERFENFEREHPEWMKQPGVTKGIAFVPAATTQRAPVEQGRCESQYEDEIDGRMRCLKSKGHDSMHQCGSWLWHEQAAAPDHAREGALRMFVWTKSPSWAAVVLAEHVTQARTLLLEEIGSSGDGSCPEREAAAKWVKERTPVIWRGPNAEFALTDSAELREQEFHSEKLQRRVKELERALADGKEGGE